MFSSNKVVSRFVDYFDKRPNSNISKLMSIFSESYQEAADTIYLVRNWKSIDEAEGTTLDLIGTNVGLSRGSADDARYRILLKAKIARNVSDGTTGSIVRVLSTILSAPKEQIEITEKWNDELEVQRAAIRISGIPAERMYYMGLSMYDLTNIIQAIVAAGVKVEVIELVGSFEFGDNGEIILSDFTGMSDENETIGGTLGLVTEREDFGIIK